MRLVYPAPAWAELVAILERTAREFPASYDNLVRRIRMIERRRKLWPHGARRLTRRPDVLVVPLIRYPFKLYYRVAAAVVEVLHIRHTGRDEGEMWMSGG